MCEPDVDGNAALLFFFKAIGVYSGESFDEGGFSVVDVAGRPDDDVLHGLLWREDTGVVSEASNLRSEVIESRMVREKNRAGRLER